MHYPQQLHTIKMPGISHDATSLPNPTTSGDKEINHTTTDALTIASTRNQNQGISDDTTSLPDHSTVVTTNMSSPHVQECRVVCFVS